MRERSLPQTFVCKGCGQTIALKPPPSSDKRTMYCCLACKLWAWKHPDFLGKRIPRVRILPRPKQPHNQCVICGKTCPRRGALVCSKTCRAEKARRSHLRKSSLSCDACGAPLVYRPGHTRSRFCSASCRRRDSRGRESFKVCQRKAKGTRRARARRVAYEPIDPLAMFARDGWHCQLCGRSTPKRLRGQMVDRAPELDHIVPLSAGGTHTYDNVQCLCRECNQKKHTKMLGQLRLGLGRVVEHDLGADEGRAPGGPS